MTRTVLITGGSSGIGAAAAEVVAMPFVAQRYYRKPKA